MSRECVGTLLLNIRGVFLIQVKDKSLAYNVFEQEVHKSKSGVYFSHFFFHKIVDFWSTVDKYHFSDVKLIINTEGKVLKVDTRVQEPQDSSVGDFDDFRVGSEGQDRSEKRSAVPLDCSYT